MKIPASKLLLVMACVQCGLVALLAPMVAGSSAAELGGGPGVSGSGGFESPLTADIGGGRQAAEEAQTRLVTMQALAEDARSRSEFAGYGRAAAVELAKRVFGIARPRWTPPQDQGSGHITSYVGENMADEVLPDGKHVLVDSSIPLRSAQGNGQLKPVALGLNSTASGYVPANPLVPVVIGKSAAEGVEFQFGLRMTPTAHAAPESAEVVGNSMFYPGTAKDTDFMLEPRPMGVEASWQLLSAESPTENSLTFTLPTGAELKLSKSVEGAAEVALEGQQLMMIPQAFATEADGASLPVSYSVSGSTLTTHADLEGNVDWPVDVDPVIWEKYGGGEYGGPGRFWSNWVPAGTEPERSTKEYGGQGYTEVVAEVLANAPSKSAWGNWSIEAPGYAAGEGAITRVDVTRLLHGEANHSNIEADLIGSNGSPVYSYDAEIPGDTKSGQILTSAALERVQAAFCADGESGGYDGGPKPFCNENYGARYFQIEVQNWEDRPYRQFVAMETATIRYLDTSNIKAEPSSASEIPGTEQPNVLGSGEHWLSEKSGAFEAIGRDPAFGVYKMVISVTGENKVSQIARNYPADGCAENLCNGEQKIPGAYASFGGGLPNGSDTIQIEASDASGMTAIWSSTIHVDNTLPYNLKITGAEVKGNTVNITEGPAGNQVTVEASEGANGVLSSGVKSLRLQVGPEQIGGAEAGCSPGPCTSKATWHLNGRTLGAGIHTMIISAVSGADMEARNTEYILDVHAAAPVAMGPGSVNPANGDFALESTDADLNYGDGALTVAQHYDSLNTSEGVDGPLGPQWAIGLGSTASLEVIEFEGHEEGVMAVGPEGLAFFSAAKEGGGYEPPPGNSELTLEKTDEGREFVLENTEKAYKTTFSKPSEKDQQWLPTIVEGPSKTNTLTDSYKSIEVEAGKTIIEPTEELAPHGERVCPPEVSKMQKGCRALLFAYEDEHEATKQLEATGENESQWGWHKGRLTQISAAVWNSAAETTEAIPVEEFAYDAQGRLRAEWDPRIKPLLKTIYGYDSEGHVTAVSPPGQQPWLMTYGTIAEDGSTGRLLKVDRPKASTALWNGQLPSNEEAPAVVGLPAMGKRLAASTGKWANAPLVYSYQWERCESTECVAIAGATNPNYTPGYNEEGSSLRVRMGATNAGGTTTVTTTKSAPVLRGALYRTYEQGVMTTPVHSITAVSCLPETTDCVVSEQEGNAFYGTNLTTKEGGSWWSWAGPGTQHSSALDCVSSALCLLADGAGPQGENLYYATSLGGEWTKAYAPTNGTAGIGCVSTSLCVNAELQNSRLGYSTKPASSSWSQLSVSEANENMTAVACLSLGFCVVGGNRGSIYVAATAADIEDGAWVASDVDGTQSIFSVACNSSSSCLVADSQRYLLSLAINSSGAVTAVTKHEMPGHAMMAVSCSSTGVCVALDNQGNFTVSSNAGSSWSAFDESDHSEGQQYRTLSCASSTLCVAGGHSGEILIINPAEVLDEEGALRSPEPGSTIEYNVAVAGASAPYPMDAENVKVWGQKDLPVEAAEVFPEEHPQGWPANGHAGATVYYMDNEAQTVNVASPSGGISTTEYGEGDVVRSLSADNRQKALEEANPTSAAEKLATESTYETESGLLAEVTGPEHKVKLSSGEEVEARNHVHYHYDEGAPENGKGEVEEYGLVTKTTDGALLANGEEKDVHTTLTGYSGEKDEGWELREPTSITTEPDGVDLVSSTKYNKETGAVEETRTPGGNVETVSSPEPSFTFGSLGAGDGQLNEPDAVAIGPEGDAWVVDQDNNWIERFTSSGAFVAAYGSAGNGEGQYHDAWGIAINQENGDVYIADSFNDRVEELSNEGKFLREWGHAGKEHGEFEGPVGIAIDGGGHVWVSDYGDDRVQEFSEAGSFMRQFGSEGSGASQFKGAGEMVFSQGLLYVVDEGNDRVEEFSTSGSTVQYAGAFGTGGREQGQLHEPWGITALPATGELVVSDTGNNNIVEYSAAGKLLGTNGWWGEGANEFQGPTGLGVSATGSVYVADQYNDRISVWKQPEAGGAHMTYSTQFGTEGKGEGQFEYPAVPAVDSHGNVWVTDNTNDHVEEFSSQGKFVASYGSEGGGNGEFYGPSGIAINQATDDVYVSDMYKHCIQEFGPKGEFIRSFTSEPLNIPGAIAIDSAGDVWVTDMADDEVEEFSSAGTFMHAYGSKGSGELQFNEPVGIAVVGSTVYVADAKNNRIEEISTSGTYIGEIDKEGANGGEMLTPEGIVANSAGDLFVEDTGNDRIDEFSASGHYLETIGSFGEGNGELRWPQGIAITPAGDLYVTDPGNHRVVKWVPDNQAVHDTKSYYYTATVNGEHSECGEHPEWEDLVCRTEPAAQPTDSSAEPKGEELPELPVVTTEYNMWLQPVKTIEKIGSKERIKTTSYEGERPSFVSVTANSGETVPAVTDKYSGTLGALIEQSSEIKGESKKINRALNTLGQLEAYTDAEGNTTTYRYDQYARPVEINYDATKMAGIEAKQMLGYEETTGELTEMTDENGSGGAGTFKATFGLEGEMLSERYPNDMTASYSYNSVGEGVALKYEKNNHCDGSECEWFTDSLTPSIHGEAISQTSSLATDQYRYEQSGGLAETQETPVGEDCTAQLYAYNEEGRRTSLTTRKSGSDDCDVNEGGEVERHTYDEANRLTDEDVEYGKLGNITKLPASDAGGHPLDTTYYADGQVYSQSQDETTNTYLLDPEDRTSITETSAKGLPAASIISHYPAPGGGTPSWTENRTAGTWTRNITGFGGLIAVEESGKEAVLQLRDLQGDIIGTATPSETNGKPLTLERTTTFGVPVNEKPQDKYGWLGAEGLTSNLPSGTIVQDGTTYVPQLDTPIQAEGTPVPAPAVTVAPYVITVTAPQAFKGEEAQAKVEGAGTPNGSVPQPLGGSVEIEGNCSGGGACAASSTKCNLTWMFGAYAPDVLVLGGVVECNRAVNVVKVDECVFEWKHGSTGNLKDYGLVEKCEVEKKTKSNQAAEALVVNNCSIGTPYKAWVWGYARSGSYTYDSGGIVSNAEKCEDSIVEVEQEFGEFFVKIEEDGGSS